MTKYDLVQDVVSRTGLTALEVHKAVNAMLKVMKETLRSGERVTIRKLGEFSVKYKHARMGRNPRTGTPVKISSRKVVRFNAGDTLRERVSRPAPNDYRA